MNIDEITKQLYDIIGTYEQDFKSDCEYDIGQDKRYYVEYCTKSIERLITCFNISDRFNLFKYLFPEEKIGKDYIRKSAEKFVECNLKFVEPLIDRSTILCISNDTFFEDLQKILDNKDKGIEDAVNLANIDEKIFNSRTGLSFGPIA